MRHPVLKNKNIIYTYAGIWIFLMLIHILSFSIFGSYNISYVITDALISYFFFSLISFGLWFAIRFGINEHKNQIKRLIDNLLLFIATTGLWFFLSWLILGSFGAEWRNIFIETIYFRIIIAFLLYIIVVLMYYSINYYESLLNKETMEQRLKSLVKEAQLNELRSQLNPHFLFNSLNSINSLTISNATKAGDMIVKLSEFLRYSLSLKGQNMSNLEKELYHIQLYLEIEKIRFGSRLDYICNCPEEHKNWPMPLMILQPLIENAVKHGVYNTSETVTITLVTEIIDNFLQISISNNFDPEFTNKKGTGTGLTNVKERLLIIYNNHNLLENFYQDNIFTVKIKIPLKSKII